MTVLNLPHSVVPEQATMAVVGTLGPEFKGTREQAATAPPRAFKVHKKPISGSVTLLGRGSGEGEVVDDLPLSVREAPDVQAALAARPTPLIKLEVYEVDDPPPVQAEAPPGEPAPPESAPVEESAQGPVGAPEPPEATPLGTGPLEPDAAAREGLNEAGLGVQFTQKDLGAGNGQRSKRNRP